MKLGLWCAAVGMAMMAGCTPIKMPDWTPTPQEVPFLGQKLSQAQITDLRSQVQAKRTALQQTARSEREQCYQKFLVNNCLENSRNRFFEQDMVWRKQEAELNRQERALSEIERQQRVQESLRLHPDAAKGLAQ